MDIKAIMSFAPFVLIIVVFYFLFIKPQKKREKEVNSMRSAIKVGDQIVTIGGIRGTVTKVADESLIIAIGTDKTKMEIMRWAVSKVENANDATPAKKAAQDKATDEKATTKPKRLTKKTTKETEEEK
jgi:preprotein translocase subunit YajC